MSTTAHTANAMLAQRMRSQPSCLENTCGAKGPVEEGLRTQRVTHSEKPYFRSAPATICDIFMSPTGIPCSQKVAPAIRSERSGLRRRKRCWGAQGWPGTTYERAA
jgi:hypothetical protein